VERAGGNLDHRVPVGRPGFEQDDLRPILAERTRNATIRARTAMDVLIIPKADFDKLRQSVAAFGDAFSEVAERRTVAR